MARVGLLVGVPIAVLLGMRAMAWASLPVTWQSGDKPTAADLNGSFQALDAQLAALESGIAQNVIVIKASVTGATGRNAETACPSGYSMSVSLVEVKVTSGGTNGWPPGTYGCSNIGGDRLNAALTNYTTGSTQTSITCQGLCVR